MKECQKAKNFVAKYFWLINKPKVHKNKKKRAKNNIFKHKSRKLRDFFISLKYYH